MSLPTNLLKADLAMNSQLVTARTWTGGQGRLWEEGQEILALTQEDVYV